MLDLKVDEQFEVADLQEAGRRRFFIKLKQIHFCSENQDHIFSNCRFTPGLTVSAQTHRSNKAVLCSDSAAGASDLFGLSSFFRNLWTCWSTV